MPKHETIYKHFGSGFLQQRVVFQRLLFLIWFLVILFSISKHTPWRDEYQSFLVSTRTEIFGDFFQAVRLERHPPLHYLLQKTILSIPGMDQLPAQIQIQSVTFPFTIGIAYLLIFKLNLPLLLSGMLIFGSYYFREFGVISRCYPIGIFFLLLSLVFTRKQKPSWSWICLSIAASTHMLFTLGFCGLLAIELLKQKSIKKFLTNHGWFVLVAVALLAFQLPPADSGFPSHFEWGWEKLSLAIYYFVQALSGVENIFSEFNWNAYSFSQDSTYVFAILFLYWIRKSIPLKELALTVGLLCFFMALSYGAYYRHLGVIHSFFIYLYLRRQNSFEWKKPIWLFALIPFLAWGSWWLRWSPWQVQPNFVFSEARKAVSSLAEQGVDLKSEKYVLATEQDGPYFTLLAEADAQMYAIHRSKVLRYPRFLNSDLGGTVEEFCRSYPSRIEFADKTVLLGMLKGQVPPLSCAQTERVYASSQAVVTDESYEIYKLK